MVLFAVAAVLSALKASVVRALLVGAVEGWQVIVPLSNASPAMPLRVGFAYFAVALLYDLSVHPLNSLSAGYALLLSVALVVLNVCVFYLLFFTLCRVVYSLMDENQAFKLRLFKHFGWCLGVAAGVYVLWALTEILLKLSVSPLWAYTWVFTAVWEGIFLLLVLPLLLVWGIDKYSKMLAYAEELEDGNLSEEEVSMEMT